MLNNEDLKQEIYEHLQAAEKYVTTIDVVNFLSHKDTKKRHQLKKPILVITAR